MTTLLKNTMLWTVMTNPSLLLLIVTLMSTSDYYTEATISGVTRRTCTSFYGSSNRRNMIAVSMSASSSSSLISTLRGGSSGSLRGGGDSSSESLLYDIGGADDVMDPRGNVIEDETTVLIGSSIDYEKLVDGAYGWCCNLGAPSALVAGAVIASIYENMNNPDNNYNPQSDSKIIGFAKKLVRWLLITAFASEALCIFVTTVTGTMLLSQDIDSMLHQGTIRTAKTPLQFLYDHFEYEYLTGHIMFLQGLLNWFFAIALSHAIPVAGSSLATTTTNQFLATVLFTTAIFMMATYNKHIYFYSNYGTMLYRWVQLAIHRFIVWPPRPLSFILFPSVLVSIVLGLKVFFLSSSTSTSESDDTPTETRKKERIMS